MDGAKRNLALPKLPERSEVDPRYTWNLAGIYPNLDAWRDDFKRLWGELEAKRSARRRPGLAPP